MYTPSVESARQIASTQQTGPILAMRVNILPEVIDRNVKDQLLVDRDPMENGQRRVAYKFLFLDLCGVKMQFNYIKKLQNLSRNMM